MSEGQVEVSGLDDIRYDERGLVPAIVQEESDGTVLMLAYMNRESLARTLETGRTWFYSRSRGELWPKGETSGHVQKVRRVLFDCDADTLLVQVEQVGAACHTGERSCFYRELGGT
jgi:phosphoribosyl-ATP pyrophosphohydrolase/phosphoribosyl-AMP cyclohydrolase